MTLRPIVALVIVAALAVPFASAADRVARVAVLSSGVVQLDGRPTTAAALEDELKSLRARGGVVWYYRENPTAEPSPQAMAVIQLVVKYQLPISMSSKPDFSDYIDQHGVSRPRAR
jgi:glycine cleavage system regulatory protein